jgi:hypothetical protein
VSALKLDTPSALAVLERAIEGGFFDAEIDAWYLGTMRLSHQARRIFNARAAELLGVEATGAWFDYGELAAARIRRHGVTCSR